MRTIQYLKGFPLSVVYVGVKKKKENTFISVCVKKLDSYAVNILQYAYRLYVYLRFKFNIIELKS